MGGSKQMGKGWVELSYLFDPLQLTAEKWQMTEARHKLQQLTDMWQVTEGKTKSKVTFDSLGIGHRLWQLIDRW